MGYRLEPDGCLLVRRSDRDEPVKVAARWLVTGETGARPLAGEVVVDEKQRDQLLRQGLARLPHQQWPAIDAALGLQANMALRWEFVVTFEHQDAPHSARCAAVQVGGRIVRFDRPA